MVNRFVKPFIPLVDAIADTFGENCEVVLHDFRIPQKSIIKIANGHVTGRDIGGPATDLILSFFGKNIKEDSLVGYRTKSRKGAEIKSTTVFIKNKKGTIVGALCINIDIAPYIFVRKVFGELCNVSDTNNRRERGMPSEKFEPNVESLVDGLLKQSIDQIRRPVVHMSKEDKLKVIKNLKEKGIFFIKGTAKRVSDELNVSLASVYKYLEEIK
jgi:predicted transcriptional regulator YheO